MESVKISINNYFGVCFLVYFREIYNDRGMYFMIVYDLGKLYIFRVD